VISDWCFVCFHLPEAATFAMLPGRLSIFRPHRIAQRLCQTRLALCASSRDSGSKNTESLRPHQARSASFATVPSSFACQNLPLCSLALLLPIGGPAKPSQMFTARKSIRKPVNQQRQRMRLLPYLQICKALNFHNSLLQIETLITSHESLVTIPPTPRHLRFRSIPS
jgi:hypothetical protein